MIINFLATNNYSITFNDLEKDDTIDKIKTRIFREYSQHLPMPSSVLLEDDDETTAMQIDNLKPCILHPFQIRLLFKGRQLLNYSTLGECEVIGQSTIIIAVSPFCSLKKELEKNSANNNNTDKNDGVSTTDELVVGQDVAGQTKFILAVNDKSSFETEKFSVLESMENSETFKLLSRIPSISANNTNNNNNSDESKLLPSKTKFKILKNQEERAPIETVLDRLSLQSQVNYEREIELAKPDVEVVSMIPSGKIDSFTTVTIVFNRPFAPLSSDVSQLEVPFKITPQVPGATWKFVDGVTCKYSLPNAALFPRSTMYIVESVPEIFEKCYKETFPYKRWEIQTATQYIQQPFFNSDLKDPQFAIVFSQPMPASFLENKKRLSSFFTFTLDYDMEMDFEIIQESKDTRISDILKDYSGKAIAFKIVDPVIVFDSKLELEIEAGIPSTEGPLKTDQIYRSVFKAPPIFTVTPNVKYPDSSASVVSFSTTSILQNIQFNQLSPEDIDNLVTIHPKAEIKNITCAYGAITINANFQHLQSYKVTVKNFKDTLQQVLLPTTGHFSFPAETIEIQTHDQSSWGGSSSTEINLDPLSKPLFQIKTKGVHSIFVKVFQIPSDLNNYSLFSCNETQLKKVQMKVLDNGSLDIVHKPKEYTYTMMDLSKYFGSDNSKSVKNSLLYFVFSDTKQTVNVHKIIQYSPYIINTCSQGTTTMAWVTNAHTGEIIKKGSIKSSSNTGALTDHTINVIDGMTGMATVNTYTQYLTTVGLECSTVLPFNFTPTKLENTIKWSIFDDQGLYKPGDIVNIKGFLRVLNVNDSTLSIPPKSTTNIVYKVVDPRRVEKLTGTTTVDELGSFVFKFTLPMDTNLGDIQIEMTYGPVRHTHVVKLQEFKRKQFLVESKAAHTKSNHVMENDMFSVEVLARSYTDEVMSNTIVEWDISANACKPMNLPSGFQYSETDSDMEYFGPWKFQGKRMLSGRHKMDFVMQDMKQCYSIQVRGSIKDVTNVSETFSHNFTVYSKQLTLGVSKDIKKYINIDEAFKLDMVVVDTLGNLSDQGNIKCVLKKVPWEEDLPMQNVIERDITPSNLAPVTLEHKFESTGYHKLEITYGDSRPMRFDLFVLGPQTDTEKEYKDSKPVSTVKPFKNLYAKKSNLDLKVNIKDAKKHYEIGDEYQLIITSSKVQSANGFLFVSCNKKLVDTVPVSLVEGVATWKSVVEARHFPCLSFTVYMEGMIKLNINEQDVQRLASQFASTTLTLSLEDKKLQVSILDFKKFQTPNEKSKVTIEVKNKKSMALIQDADVTLVIVDEALTDLSHKSVSQWDPLSFYQKGYEQYVMSSLLDLTMFQDPQLKGAEEVIKPIVPNQITIRYLSGRVLIFPGVTNNISMEELRKLIEQRDGLPPSYQRLFYLNKPVQESENKKTLESLGVPNGAVLNLSIRLSGGSGQGNDDKPDPEQAPPKIIRLRDNFNSLATFQVGRTTKSGIVQFELTLPDNLTSYKIMALAATRECFGSSEDTFTSTLPVMIRQSAPRFLNYNDECVFPIAIQSIVNYDLDVKFAITSSTCKLLNSGYKAHLSAGGRVTIPITARAQVPNRNTIFQCAVSTLTKDGEEFTDAIKFEFPVHSPTSTESVSTNYALESSSKEYFLHDINLPNWSQIDQNIGGLTVNLSNSPLTKMTDGLRSLLNYEYACSEQLASKLLALAFIEKYPELYKPDTEEDKKLKASIKSTMEKMIDKLKTRYNSTKYTFRYWDGADSNTYDYVNIYVHWIMNILDKKFNFAAAGFCKTHSGKYLSQYIEAFSFAEYKKSKEKLSYLTKIAFACFVYSSLSSSNNTTALAKKIFALAVQDYPKLYAEILIILIPQLQDTKEFKNITNFMKVSGTGAYFDATSIDGFYSESRINSIAVINLIQTQPKHALLSKLVRGLSNSISLVSWNTQDNAFASYAIYCYHSTTFGAVTANVYLNQNQLDRSDIALDQTKTDHQLKLSMSTLIKNQGQLVIEKLGKGQLFYNINLTYGSLNPFYKAVSDRGFSIERTFIGMQNISDVQYLENGNVWIKSGSKIKVEIKIKVELNSSFVVIRDCLPAGLEPTLALYNRKSYWMSHLNIRDKGCEIFVDRLYRGNYTFTYFTAAISRGQFICPPSKIEEMYCAATFGRTKTEMIHIE